MGSYLSIVNDTADTFHCYVGDDQSALSIASIIVTVIGALATIVSLGAAAPGMVITFGAGGAVATVSIASTSVAATLAASFGAATTAARVLFVIIDQSTKDLKNKGYVEIPPGGRQQIGKMSLSLWRQGHCVRHRSFPERMEIKTDEVFMRPIFSGPTDNSNLDHSIQFWIEKHGFENEKTIVIPPPEDAGGSWGDVNAPFSSPLAPMVTSAKCHGITSTRFDCFVTSTQVPNLFLFVLDFIQMFAVFYNSWLHR